MIPCEECLVLAICRNKAKIHCSLLYDCFQSSHDNRIYDEISKHLGCVYRLSTETSVIVIRKIINEQGEYVWI